MSKILIVDDKAAVRELLLDVLKKESYEVTTASTGKEAIESVKTWEPDLVLLDIKMPDMDGLEVLKRIRSFDSKTKIVVLTEYGLETLEREARLAGATDFLRKGLGIDIIVKAVNEIFKERVGMEDSKMAGKKILVIDDEKEVLKLMKDYLNILGMEAVLADIPGEGVKLAKSEKPDVILLDIMMPDMSGDEIARVLAKDPVTSNIPIIFLTALAGPEDTQKSLRGDHNFLPKSLPAEDFLKELKEFLSRV
ncbi:response regulator [candidate division WOR-3 bacterium]|nr:response regulator [candidate division WOR-3 bacterium]